MLTDVLKKIKCDEKTPHCQQCVTKGLLCPGYSRPVVWSSKYHKYALSSNNDWFNEAAEVEAALKAFVPRTATRAPPVQDTPPAPSPSNEECRHSSNELAENPRSSAENLLDSNSLDSGSPSNTSNQAPLLGQKDIEPPPAQYDAQDTSTEEFNLTTTDLWNCSWSDFSSTEYIEQHAGRTFRGLSFSTSNAPQLTGPFVSPLLPVQNHQESFLIQYYFATVCPINSCFDSLDNPLRADIGLIVAGSALIHNTVASMAAAHLGQIHVSAQVKALEHQQSALSELMNQVRMLQQANPEEETLAVSFDSCGSHDLEIQVLLGVILLGISSVSVLPSAPLLRSPSVLIIQAMALGFVFGNNTPGWGSLPDEAVSIS